MVNLFKSLFRLLIILTTTIFIYTPSTFAEYNFFVFGGEVVGFQDLLYHHSVKIRDERGAYCSGSIIANNMILTAAHCSVQVGHEILFGEEVRVITESHSHPDLDTSKPFQQWSDYAVLKFEEGLPEGFKPIKIAEEGFTVLQDEEVWVSGFGRAGVLDKVDLAILNPDYPYNKYLVSQHEFKGGCYGDSGGSLTVKQKSGEYILIGVVSGAVEAGSCAEVTGGLYSKVNVILSWLEELGLSKN